MSIRKKKKIVVISKKRSENIRRSRGRSRESANFPLSPTLSEMPNSYAKLLKEIKEQISNQRIRATLAANASMVLLYWDVGQTILQRQEKEGWGSKVIDRLAFDLRQIFPEMKGISSRNLKYMRAFAETWPDRKIVQEVLAQITWYHNIALMEKLDDQETRLWYAQKTILNGWSRNILTIQIESNLHCRQGKAINNFKKTLPKPDSDLMQQTFKDPYLLDFLIVDGEAREREIESSLIENLEKFLLELGAGFAFVGRQVHLEVGEEDYYIDLLFYHLKLRCYVVIELKAGEFKAEFAGKLNFYLSAVDDLLRHPDDKPTIGLLLCKTRNRLVAEYALGGIQKPIGVAEWETKIVKALPEELKSNLPTIEQLEAELSNFPKRKNVRNIKTTKKKRKKKA